MADIVCVLQRNKMDSNLWKSNDDFNWKVLAKLFDLNEQFAREFLPRLERNKA